MRRSLLLLSVLSLLLVLGACASEPAKAPEPAADAKAAPDAAPDASADPLSGTWKGDWGPSPTHRNPVTLELKLDGANLTGTVNPGGPDAIPLTKASFTKDTGMVSMEADAKGHGGEAIHYTIEGKLDGTTMTGSWNHGEKNKGDFKITKG